MLMVRGLGVMMPEARNLNTCTHIRTNEGKAVLWARSFRRLKSKWHETRGTRNMHTFKGSVRGRVSTHASVFLVETLGGKRSTETTLSVHQQHGRSCSSNPAGNRPLNRLARPLAGHPQPLAEKGPDDGSHRVTHPQYEHSCIRNDAAPRPKCSLSVTSTGIWAEQ